MLRSVGLRKKLIILKMANSKLVGTPCIFWSVTHMFYDSVCKTPKVSGHTLPKTKFLGHLYTKQLDFENLFSIILEQPSSKN